MEWMSSFWMIFWGYYSLLLRIKYWRDWWHMSPIHHMKFIASKTFKLWPLLDMRVELDEVDKIDCGLIYPCSFIDEWATTVTLTRILSSVWQPCADHWVGDFRLSVSDTTIGVRDDGHRHLLQVGGKGRRSFLGLAINYKLYTRHNRQAWHRTTVRPTHQLNKRVEKQLKMKNIWRFEDNQNR